MSMAINPPVCMDIGSRNDLEDFIHADNIAQKGIGDQDSNSESKCHVSIPFSSISLLSRALY